MTIRDGIRLGLGLTIVAVVFGTIEALVAGSTTDPTERMVRMLILGVIGFVLLFAVSVEQKKATP